MEQDFGKRAKFIQHRGVEIIVTDYSGLKGEQLYQLMKQNSKIIVPRVQGRRDCIMVNIFRNCEFGADSMRYIAKMQKAMGGTFVASALVGMSNIQRMGIEITGALKKANFATKFFDEEKEALDWAVEVHRTVSGRRD